MLLLKYSTVNCSCLVSTTASEWHTQKSNPETGLRAVDNLHSWSAAENIKEAIECRSAI